MLHARHTVSRPDPQSTAAKLTPSRPQSEQSVHTVLCVALQPPFRYVGTMGRFRPTAHENRQVVHTASCVSLHAGAPYFPRMQALHAVHCVSCPPPHGVVRYDPLGHARHTLHTASPVAEQAVAAHHVQPN